MASDNLRTEYHLTPDGWVEGTERYFNSVRDKEVARPDNAVETWECQIYQQSDWSPEDHRVRRVWHDPSKSTEELKTLREQFGPPDKYFKMAWENSLRRLGL